MAKSDEHFSVIPHSYLIVQNIPYFVDESGQVLLERSWHHDLVQHLQYIPNLTLAAPLRQMPAQSDNLVPLDYSFRSRLRLVPLPEQNSRLQAFWQLPSTLRILWRVVGDAKIVHSGIVGWPYPIGWLANPIAHVRRKKNLIIVESAPWRVAGKGHSLAPLRKRLEALIYEYLARYWCSRADLSFYTQPGYLTQLHGNAKGPAYVTPASWVNSEDVLDESQAELLWESKRREPVRFLFAGRLETEKGVLVLLEAVDKLATAGIYGSVDVIGDGSLRQSIVAAQREGPFALKYLRPLPYGPQFQTFLQTYHALVVPSLSDEQPRVVFDAAARAVPILASDTDGLRACVENHRTGRLIVPGDSQVLADAMADWTKSATDLRTFGMEALSRVRVKTHRAMHAERSRIIVQHLCSSKN